MIPLHSGGGTEFNGFAGLGMTAPCENEEGNVPDQQPYQRTFL